MKIVDLFVLMAALGFSGSAISQSVQITNPREGDAVSIEGFMVHVTIEGLQEFVNEENHDAFIQFGLMHDESEEWEAAYVGTFCQPSANYNFHFWGRCVKFVHPDLYLNSFCASENDRLKIVYRAENFAEEMYVGPFDTIALRIRAWGHTPSRYYEDIVTVILE